jgi:hypothetical protein
MKKYPPPLNIRVEFEPNRFSFDSLTKVYEQLKQIQSYPISNKQKNDEVSITRTSKVGDNG